MTGYYFTTKNYVYFTTHKHKYESVFIMPMCMHFRKKSQCKVLDLLKIDFTLILILNVTSILYRIIFLALPCHSYSTTCQVLFFNTLQNIMNTLLFSFNTFHKSSAYAASVSMHLLSPFSCNVISVCFVPHNNVFVQFPV